MAQLTTVQAAPMFKVIYGDQLDSKTMLLNKPLSASLEHRKNFATSTIEEPLQFGIARGRSKTVGISAGNQVPGKYSKFTIPQKSDYLTSSLDGVVVRRAANGGDSTQFTDLLKAEMDGALENLGQEIERELFGSQSGSRARVHPSTAIATTSLTLANPKDALFFAAGDQVVGSQTDGGALRDTGDYVTLISVNQATGVLVADANWSNISGLTNNDYLYCRGDAINAGSGNLGKLGLRDYCPTSSPVALENFLGVDRSVAPDQLAGRRIDGTGESMQTVFLAAQAELAFATGGAFNKAKIFINPMDFKNLRISLEGSRFIDEDNEYQIGIESFRVGTMPISQAPHCPKGLAYIVGEGAMYRATCGDQPALNSEDSLEYRLNTTTDVYEFQMVYEGNNVCKAPHKLAVVSLPTA